MKQIAGWWLPDADTYFGPILERHGGYHIDHLEAALRWVPEDRRGLCVEAGAHVGIWTRRLAEEFDHVIAIEPARDTYEALTQNVYGQAGDVRGANVFVINGALGAQNGRCDCVADLKRPGNTGARYICIKTGTPTKFEVPMFMLDHIDTIAPRWDGPMGFLKLDVEGSEHDVLTGGETVIRRDRPTIIIEDKHRTGRRFGHPDGSAQALLASWGARMVERIGCDYIYLWS